MSSRSTWLRCVNSAIGLALFAAAISLINLIIDPADVLKRDLRTERRFAEIVTHGGIAGSTWINGWRNITVQIVRNLHQSPELILLGSSTSFEVRQNVFGEHRFLNLAMTGGNLEDHVITLSLLLQKNLKPQTVILSIDPWLFTNGSYELWKGFGVNAINQENIFALNVVVPKQTNASLREILKASVSPSYFQASVRMLMKGGLHINADAFEVASINELRSDAFAKFPDGSNYMENFINTHKMTSFGTPPKSYRASIAPERVIMLDQLIAALHKRGIKVVFWVPPFNSEFTASYPQYVEEYDETYTEIAKRNGISVFGSAWGERFGCKKSEFYGVDHPRESCVQKVFSNW